MPNLKNHMLVNISNYILYLIITFLLFILVINLPTAPHEYVQISNNNQNISLQPISPKFKDETISQGIVTPHMQSSNTLSGLPESFRAGACILDYNNDGWMDIFLINGSGQRRYFGEKEWWQDSMPFTLYQNTGMNSFEDVTDTTLGHNINGWGMGCSAADLDNDGDQDLIIANYGSNILLKNNGDGTFKDITIQSNIQGNQWSTSILTADFNNDGLLDIYILNFIDYKQDLNTYEASSGYDSGDDSKFNASLYNSSSNRLYINKGNLIFKDETKDSGLDDSSGKGISAETLDINHDNLLDIFISNGQGSPNKLFINNGNLSFTDASETYKISSIQKTTGVKSADIDHDGYIELLIGTDNKNSKLLYKNEANTLLVDIAKKSGLDKTETSGSMTWGVSLSDLNNDGYSDIFLANGFSKPDSISPRKPQGQPNTLLINTPSGFQNCDSTCYLKSPNDRDSSKSVIPVDIDNDGDTDLYISQNNSLGKLLINYTIKKNWLGINLIGNTSNKDALGSIVTLKTKNKKYTKTVSNSSFLSSHDKRVIFHFGDEHANELIIQWSNGLKTILSDLPNKHYISIKEKDNSFSQYKYSVPKPAKSKIIFSEQTNKVEVVKWLASSHRKNDANIEAKNILDNNPTNQALIKLVEISDLLNPQVALKVNLLGIENENIKVQLESLKKLKYAEEEITSRFLLNLFADPSPEIRCEVAMSYLHFFKEEEAMIHSKYHAIPNLIQALSDSIDDVKICAINALGESEHHRAVQPLIQLISSTNKYSKVRTRAIIALGRLREKKAETLLTSILHNPNESIKNRYSAMSSLKRLNVINEKFFIKENLTAYHDKGRALDFLQLLLSLSKDSAHNIIFNPITINDGLRNFTAENKNSLTEIENTLIEQIISESKNGNESKNTKTSSKNQTNSYLNAKQIKEMQTVLSTPSENIDVRTNILNNDRVSKLFSTKRIMKTISANRTDPLRNTAIIALVENTSEQKELTKYKRQMLDPNYAEEYRFNIAKGLMKIDSDFVINNVLTK